MTERVILLVRTAGDDDVIGRLRAELADSDWKIVELRLDDGPADSALAPLARREGAAAAVRLDPVQGVLELWIARPDGDIEETIGAPGENTSSSVLALGATEALRARGLALDSKRAEARAAETTARAAERTAPFRTSRPQSLDVSASAEEPASSVARQLWAELAPAVALSAGGLGPSFQTLLGARFELDATWSLGAFGLLPLLTQEVSGTEGSARVSNFLVAAVADAALVRARGVDLSSGVGVGGSLSSMRGDEPGPGYRAEAANVAAAAGFARASLRLRVSEGVRFSARALAGTTVPEVSIRFEDREVARWGRPFFVASVGVEIALLNLDQ